MRPELFKYENRQFYNFCNYKNASIITKPLVIITIIVSSFISNDEKIILGLLFYYLWGQFLRIILLNRLRNNVIGFFYDFFFCVYSLLVVVTQVELIHDPFTDFFIHNDASDAFYIQIVEQVLPTSWSDLPQKTLFSPFFSHYPLAAFLFGGYAKIGQMIGVDSLRLFLRFQSVITGVLTICLMCGALIRRGLSNRTILKSGFVLGFFSYLYITSAIFTRDVLVAFSYTYIAYIYLLPRTKYRFLLFLIGILIATGFRPENGLIAILFLLAFYYPSLKKKWGVILVLIVCGAAIVMRSYIIGLLSTTKDLFSYYNGYINDNAGGGLFMKLYSLPFPISQIAMVLYVLVMPVPCSSYVFSMYGSLMCFPSIVIPFLSVWVYVSTASVVFNKQKQVMIYDKLLILVLLFIYVMMATISPDLRRVFAGFPALYTCYVLTKDCVAHSTYMTLRKFIIPIVIVFHVFSAIYIYIIR